MAPGPAHGWLILADDLTGAADCAAPFARRGLVSVVGWAEAPPHQPAPDVLAYDADTRDLPAALAADQQVRAVKRLLGRRALFKKIDSTLRGQPAAEIASLAPLLHARNPSTFGIFAPAFPATGRSTVGGRVLLHGAPLEQSEVWRRDHSYPTADLVRMLTGAGVATRLANVAQVREAGALGQAFEAAAVAGEIVVCDAETDADLQAIARAGLAAAAPFFIGSAGLAHALAALTPEGARAPLMLPPASGGTLLVVGSLAAASRGSARRLAREGQVVALTIAPATLLDATSETTGAFAERVGALLAAGRDVLVELEAADPVDTSLSGRLAAALAETLAPAAAQMAALAATGGETAAALLRRFEVDGVRLIGEIEPGVPIGQTFGRLSIPLVTKAGAFGDEGSLGRIAAALRARRSQETSA